jgi:hypothetical protein
VRGPWGGSEHFMTAGRADAALAASRCTSLASTEWAGDEGDGGRSADDSESERERPMAREREAGDGGVRRERRGSVPSLRRGQSAMQRGLASGERERREVWGWGTGHGVSMGVHSRR